MADYYSTACGGANAVAASNKFATPSNPAFLAGAPAKSGVRDVLRIPFAVYGDGATLLTAADQVYLVKVAAAHRVVGYYIEAVSGDTNNALRFQLEALLNAPTSGTYSSLVTAAATGATGAVLSQFGGRGSNGTVIAASGTFVAGALPTEPLTGDGVVRINVTTTAGANTSWKFSGYIETLPV